MLYLFNSGYRKYQRVNILNTLFLTDNVISNYRYRFRGHHINIDPELNKHIKKGEEVLISYIDRFSDNGYRYIPIRYGEFIEIIQDQDYYYFHVKLKEVVSPYNENTSSDKIIKALSSNGLAKLTNQDPNDKNDGYYALLAEKIFNSTDELCVSDKAWDMSVDIISKTKFFVDEKYLFLKFSILYENKAIIPEPKGNQSFFPISKLHEYKVKLSYRFPFQENNPDFSKSVIINFSNNLNPDSSPEIIVNDYTHNFELPFSIKRYCEDKNSTIKIQQPQEDFIVPDSILKLKIKDGLKFWVQIIIAILLFSFISAIITIDFSTVSKSIFTSIWPKILLAFINSFVLLWLLKLTGKKLF